MLTNQKEDYKVIVLFVFEGRLHIYHSRTASVLHIQGRSKVFTTGQARFNPEHYVIKHVGGR